MTTFQILAVLITLAAACSYLNHKFLHLPGTIGVMLISLAFSAMLIGIDQMGIHLVDKARMVVSEIDLENTLLNGMLGALLFAGALHVNFDDLARQKWAITLFSTAGVIISTVLTGFATYYVLHLLGIEIRLIFAMLFGALISPTDPIAVLGILKHAGAPKELETKITGESLFNDGIGVVVYVALLDFAGLGHGESSAQDVALLFLKEALGGLGLGLAIGGLAFILLKRVDKYQVEVLVTLAVVTGGYALAMALHTSGPLAMVAAGLLVGNHGRALAMSDRTRQRLDEFWELIDEILNAVLFVLIGLELLIIQLEGRHLLAGAILIPLLLAARFISIGVPVSAIRLWRKMPRYTVRVLTWAGLRGGISVALALSLPASPDRNVLITMTYVIVVFSIAVQGLSTGKVIRALLGRPEVSAPAHS